MKILCLLLLTVTLTCLYSCNTKKAEYKKIVGQEYYSLTEFKPFIYYNETGCSYIEGIGTANFTLHQYSYKEKSIIAFEKIVDESHRRSKYLLLDILEIPELKKSQYLGYGYCRMNGFLNQDIIAVYEAPDLGEEFYTQIVKAWRANPKTKKIEEISVKGIDCENDVYGEE